MACNEPNSRETRDALNEALSNGDLPPDIPPLSDFTDDQLRSLLDYAGRANHYSNSFIDFYSAPVHVLGEVSGYVANLATTALFKNSLIGTAAGMGTSYVVSEILVPNSLTFNHHYWRDYSENLSNQIRAELDKRLDTEDRLPTDTPDEKDGDPENDNYNPDDCRDDYPEREDEGKSDLDFDSKFVKPPASPLVIDLDNDGIELLALAESQAFFDLNVDGYAEQTGWVSPDDALLAIDSNNNGYIDDNSELFGNMTGFEDGFSQLSELDSNSNGIIDANDENFSALLVWQDLNGDGISQPNELQSLSDVGIVSIDLSAELVDQENEGHIVTHTSFVTFDDGTESLIQDIHFQNDPSSSQTILPEDFEYHEDAFILPTLFGYGRISSTIVAYSLDSELRDQAFNLLSSLNGGDISTFLSDFESFILNWAGVEDVPVDGSGEYVSGQHLAFLEAAYGVEYNDGALPLHDQGQALEDYYSVLFQTLAGRFMSQAALSQAHIGSSTTDEYFSAFANHPLFAFTNLAVNSSNDSRELDGDLSLVLAGLNFSIESGTISAHNAAQVLYLVRYDFAESLQEFDELLETLLPDAGIDYSSEFYQELKVQAGYQIAMADQNHDVIQTEGHFFSIGSDGDDTIISNLVSDMDSVLMGGKGDDYLYGSEGTQIYIYSLGDGNDTIFDNSLQGEMDRLIFTDIKYDEVVFKGKNKDTDSIYDFVEIHLPDGAIITLENYILHPHANGIEFVELSDGTELDRAQVFQAVVDEQSSEGDDIIIGLQFDDILDGGLGNDVLQGGTGADTYVYNFGDGNDIIQDISSLGELDNLHLNDVNATDVIFSGNENDDLIVTMSDGATITIEGQFDGFNKAIEIVEFADGTTLGLAGIATKLIADQTTDGDDTIKGSNLDDLITGGLGDDLIEGGKGADTYVYALGDGHDVIEDYDGSAVNDKILFSDLNADDVTFNRNSGDDLVISTSDGGTITVTDHFDNGAEDMEVIEFADGTTLDLDGIAVKAIVDQSTSGDDIILGTDGDDVVTAGLGDDSIEGGKGADIYHYSFGDGSDVIKDLSAYGETDKLIFGDLNASDVLFSISGDDDLVITMSDDATITVWDHFDGSTEQIEQIEFADGTVLDLEAISSKAVADQVPQEPEEVASNDTITGTTGDDTLQGGLGDDQIDGGRGSDTYIYRLGDGHDYIKDVSSYSYEIDTLLFTDVNASDVTFNQNSGDDLIITLSDGGTVTIDEHYDSHTKDMEQIQFADGSVLDVDAIAIKMLEDASTSGNDTIYGTSGADTIEGGLGDDRLEGGRDGDTYVYNFGDGHDYIKDVSSYAETDTLVFTDLNASDVVFSENNDDLVITMSDGGTVTIYEHFDSHTKDMEQVQFADGIILDLVGIEDKLQDDSLLIA